jgi:hypothetical protein
MVVAMQNGATAACTDSMTPRDELQGPQASVQISTAARHAVRYAKTGKMYKPLVAIGVAKLAGSSGMLTHPMNHALAWRHVSAAMTAGE